MFSFGTERSRKWAKDRSRESARAIIAKSFNFLYWGNCSCTRVARGGNWLSGFPSPTNRPTNNPERLVSLIINFSVPRSHRFYRRQRKERERERERERELCYYQKDRLGNPIDRNTSISNVVDPCRFHNPLAVPTAMLLYVQLTEEMLLNSIALHSSWQ